jgi:thymidylate kinase
MQRSDFMHRLFSLLEQEGLEYVVLRNFDAVFAESNSDVDILARDAERFYAIAAKAAAETGHCPVQQTRFANYSRLYWNGAASFTRIDVDTSLRWRIFPAVDEDAVLARRIRAEHFYIPSPADEIAALRLNIAWYPAGAPKYAARLAELGAEPVSPESLRSAIIRRCLSPRRWPAVLRNCADDLRRLVGRNRNPPGAVFQLVTVAPFDEAALRKHLAPVFPTMKNACRAEYRIALFKGGLAVEVTRVNDDQALGDTVPLAAPLGNPSRNFIGALRRDGTLDIAHAGSGRMVSVNASHNPEEAAARAVLEMLAKIERDTPRTTGVSVLLVGLDGAGKTTFARRLCGRPEFPAYRYFHWIPGIADRLKFPWPVFRDLPRKRGRASGALKSITSSLRLLRNLIRAWLFWWIAVRPLVLKGRLVILDRFAANYWLDADSVRWSGPPPLLALFRYLLPKPDVMLLLDAEPSVLAKRKSELSEAELHVQRERLLALPKLAGRVARIDASLPPHEVVAVAIPELKRS